LAAKAARRFAGARLQENAGRLLPATDPPAWVFVHGRLNPLSATAIRTAPEAGRRGKRTRPAVGQGR
jgi:nicotinate-nucleotide adenylyltransferase